MASLSWNRERAAHLYRRAGFGATPQELSAAVSLGREAAVDRLVNFETISTRALDLRLASYRFDLKSFLSLSDPDFEKAYQQFVNLRRWWYLRMVYTPRPLEEKLTLFWHNHFPTSYSKVDTVPLLYAQNNLLRRFCAGRFEELLLEVAKDRAMLFYLDNNTNVKDAIQENWGRELLELFTMGVNRYTQADVRAAAAAFTGWTSEFEPPYAFYFDPEQHEYGPKTFLGHTGDLDGGDIIQIVARRPETAEYLTAKLARFFLGHNPGGALSRRLADLYFERNGNIKALVRAILLSDDFDQTADARDQIKSPTEFIVGALRALGAWTDGSNIADYYGAPAGQSLFIPPNVAGWPAYTYGGQRWFNTGAYFARTHFAMQLAAARPGSEDFSWDAERFFAKASISSANGLIDFTADRLGMLPISQGLRQALRDYLANAGSVFRWNRDSRDRWGRGVVRLLVSSPEYQVQ